MVPEEAGRQDGCCRGWPRGQRQGGGEAPAPGCGAEREKKGHNRANEPPQFKKTNSLPPYKQNNREQGKNKAW